MTNLHSSAPHIHRASVWDENLLDWGVHSSPVTKSESNNSNNRGRLLWKGKSGLPEAGIWDVTPGAWNLLLPADELCHFVRGRGRYQSRTGEVIEVSAGTVVHFKEGWGGIVEVFENTRAIYMLCRGGEEPRCPVLREPAILSELNDWGVLEKHVDDGNGRASQVFGMLLNRMQDGRSESGIWVCTPGIWRCTLLSDELCHFLSGYCTYTHDSGEVIKVRPDTAAFFPQGWSGQCRVHKTVRKVYMIR